jgi:hypothetical protein
MAAKLVRSPRQRRASVNHLRRRAAAVLMDGSVLSGRIQQLATSDADRLKAVRRIRSYENGAEKIELVAL